MTANEKHREEQEEAKNARIARLLSAAFDLFSKKGIDTIAITDIAKNAEIGVASVYRYFSTKDEIAIRCAIWSWESRKEEFLQKVTGAEFDSKNGLEQFKIFCSAFKDLFAMHGDFLRFIYFFDSYIYRQEISTERLAEYEKTISVIQELISSSIKKGIEDGSIHMPDDCSEYDLYISVTHALFSTAQKLSLSGSMLDMDKRTDAIKQLDLMTRMMIRSLSV